MVSAISLCLLVLGLSAASSQLLSGDEEFPEAPTPERRTFKHGKPLKVLSLSKKYKKFGGFIPHAFGKAPYVEIPVIHEAPKPVYKVHRYPGVEVKPTSDISFSTPEPFVETHSIEPPSGDFVSDFESDHDHSFPPPSSVVMYPEFKPVFSQPPPAHAVLPPAKPIFSYVPAPAQPVFQAVPIQPIFTSIPIIRPAPIPALPQPAPVFSHVTPAQPIFPIKFHQPVFQAPSPPPVFHAPPPAPVFQAPSPPPVFHAPSPAPVFQSIPIKIPAPVLPPLPAPSSPPVLVKIPTPVVPSLPVPSPSPVLPVVSATPAPVFPSFPVSLPPPQLPAPSPSLPTFTALQSGPVTPEPELPYPPSGAPIPSFIKDISLGDVEIPGSPLPTIVTPKYEEVTPTIIDDAKTHDQVLGAIKNDNGLFQKLKGWKADKANAALGHFAHFRPKPTIGQLDIPAYHNFQLPGSGHSLPLAPAPVFFPPAAPFKYENFPPNNIESPPLFNSYGAPIPPDSYSRIPHDRLSSAASEEEPAVVPAPNENKQQQQPQPFKPQVIPREHPVYVANENKTKEENKTIEDVHPDPDDYKTEKEPTADDAASNYPNHKE